MNKEFCAVIVPADADAYVVKYNALTDLIAALKQFVGTQTQIFPYEGVTYHITAGRPKRLMVGTQHYPLYNEEKPTLEIDVTGSMS
jgi:hypothetical protein